jgi:hypothetical protein
MSIHLKDSRRLKKSTDLMKKVRKKKKKIKRGSNKREVVRIEKN